MANEVKEPAKLWLSWSNLPSAWQDDEQLSEAVQAALVRYSRDKPRRAVGSFVGDGTGNYDLSAQSLTGWEENSSVVMRVDAPWVLGEDNRVEEKDWSVEDDPSNGKTLVLYHLEPAATDTVRVVYTASYTEADVPTSHITAVSKLAAAGFARMLAARRAQSSESSLQADTTNGNTESQQWISIARAYEQEYERDIGLAGSQGGDSVPIEAASFHYNVDEGGHAGAGKLHEYED